MFDKLEILNMAQGLARHSSARQAVIARNIAHADTPGYKAQDIAAFSASYYENKTETNLRTTRPGHLAGTDASFSPVARTAISDAALSPNGNSVSLEEEMLKSAETKKKHDLALTVYQTSLGVLRTSIGRGV